ncbi:MAG TPA: lanthionine synthetase C family protein [Nonomuraea sp.]|nr:lanthionine synthetase C family protein [Nonomuraea sp.]
MTDLRERAGAIVEILADRISDPDVVHLVANAEPALPWEAEEKAYEDLSLVNGYPGVALLFAELGRTWSHRRSVGHVMLARATTRPHPPTGGSLYIGLPALAFATRIAAIQPDDYRSLLEPLDRYVRELAERQAHTWHQRTTAPGHTAGSMSLYDVIGGLAGTGRYLLLAGPQCERELRTVLSFLVAITRPGVVAGNQVPGWWVSGGPRLDIPDDPAYRNGHANLGLSHGIPGPLALFALAWRAGVRVPGQREAMEDVVEWLLEWRRSDAYGLCWPETVTMDEHLGRRDPKFSYVATWCYGAPGIARAIQLAGAALSRPDWKQIATDAMRSLANRPEHQWGLHSASLCHGWAGLLHAASRIAADSDGDPAALRVADVAAQRMIDLFDADLPFGYRYPMPAPRKPADGVGLLEGAAGTALALHGYATGSAPKTRWDAALMVT